MIQMESSGTKSGQKQLKFTVSPEAEAAFKKWSLRHGHPTKVFYAMWRTLLDLGLAERLALMDGLPKGSEATPAWAKEEYLEPLFKKELTEKGRNPRRRQRVVKPPSTEKISRTRHARQMAKDGRP